jgi:hypothetical protein
MTDDNGGRIGRVTLKNGPKLRILPQPTGGDPQLVEMMVETLDRVRRGEVAGMAFVIVTADGAVRTGWTQTGPASYHGLTSGTAALLTRLSGSN